MKLDIVRKIPPFAGSESKNFAEDIEIALEDVTKETFDKQKVKAKVRELQAKRREAEKGSMRRNGRGGHRKGQAYLMQLKCFLRSKSKSLKIQQALKFHKLFSQHGSKSSNRRHREKQMRERKRGTPKPS
ncbi:unnamed protein product [Bathycoccus prasinos]